MGTYTLKLAEIEAIFECSYENMDKVDLASIQHLYVTERHQKKRVFRVIACRGRPDFETLDRFLGYFLNVTTDAATYVFDIASCELTRNLMASFEKKSINLELVSLNLGRLEIEVDLKLADTLDRTTVIQQDPSEPNFKCINWTPSNLFYVMDQFGLIQRAETGEAKNVRDMDEDDEKLTDAQANKRKENLFDLVYERRGELQMADVSNERIQEMSGLRPALRPYQIEAVKWMLHKETNEQNGQPQMHPFYLRVVNSRDQVIYMHRFFGIYSLEMPIKMPPLPGGILADEMGLGKTLEVLALIGLNRYHVTHHQPIDDLSQKSTQESVGKPEVKKSKGFSCVCGAAPTTFSNYDHEPDEFDDEEMDTQDEDDDVEFEEETDTKKKRRGRGGLKNSKIAKSKTVVKHEPKLMRTLSKRAKIIETPLRTFQCVKCGVYSHPDCLNFRGHRSEFVCIKCCAKNPLESACTLIVTPFSICQQWMEEIEKHMKSSHLKVRNLDLTDVGCLI